MEWYIYRPDAIFALEDEKVKRTLNRYVRILKENLLPKFQLAKFYEVDFNPNSNTEDLLDLHRNYLKDFIKFVKEYDNNSITLDKKPEQSLLDLKTFLAEKIVEKCEFCEWKCKVNRKKGELGVCKVGYYPKIASKFIHLGEEPWITPSFTIFFSGCNFKCVYCQNFDISQNPNVGFYIDEKSLAKEIDDKFKEGVRNVNFVGGEPTPNLHYILKVLKFVEEPIPIVWNSNAYESIIGQEILAGVIDVYLYDFKYGNDKCALKYSKIPKYFETVTRNFKFAINYGEISFRVLVLPNHVNCCAKPILKWIKDNLGNKVLVHIMNQYRPEYLAHKYKEINRELREDEFLEIIEYTKKLNLIFKSQK